MVACGVRRAWRGVVLRQEIEGLDGEADGKGFGVGGIELRGVEGDVHGGL